MSEQEYLKRLKSALLVRGVWGNSATKMIEQLSDHYRGVMQELCEDGKSEEEARGSMESLLGSPEIVASAAAEEMRNRTLLGRFPWLIGGLGVFLGVLACGGAILFCGIYLSGFREPHLPHETYAGSIVGLKATTIAFNWTPWVLSCLVLAWHGWRRPIGWKALIIAALSIGLGSAAFVAVAPYKPGYIVLNPETWFKALWSVIFWLPHLGNYWTFASLIAWLASWTAWLKLLLPMTFCLVVRKITAEQICE